MKKNYIDFVCVLHGYLIRVKEIHWSTDSNAIHKLCDEIEDDIHDTEDRFAECVMGMEGKKFKVGNLMPMLPNAEELGGVLKEFEKDVIDFKKSIQDVPQNGGIFNILDEMIELANKYKYRATQK